MQVEVKTVAFATHGTLALAACVLRIPQPRQNWSTDASEFLRCFLTRRAPSIATSNLGMTSLDELVADGRAGLARSARVLL